LSIGEFGDNAGFPRIPVLPDLPVLHPGYSLLLLKFWHSFTEKCNPDAAKRNPGKKLGPGIRRGDGWFNGSLGVSAG
jgi:hypothetical protein